MRGTIRANHLVAEGARNMKVRFVSSVFALATVLASPEADQHFERWLKDGVPSGIEIFWAVLAFGIAFPYFASMIVGRLTGVGP